MNYKIYICHYPPLIERKQYLDSILPTLDIPYEYSTDYTTYTPEHEKYFSNDIKILNYKNEISASKNNTFTLTKAGKALCLEHYNIYKKIIQEKIDFGIILEDDAIFVENIKEKLHNTIKNIPNDSDIIHMSNGCGDRENCLQLGRSNLPVVNNFVKMSIPFSWTGGAYIINNKTAELFYKNVLPFVFPMDFELTFLQSLLKSCVYWLETPIIFEGSNSISGEFYKYQSTAGR